MTILSVTMRTASLSTTGTSPRSVLAGAVLALGGERRDHRRDEAGAAGTERAGLGEKGGRGILGAGTKQHGFLLQAFGGTYFQQNLTSASLRLRVA